MDHGYFLANAVAEARRGVDSGHGGPFGAVLVRDGAVVAAAHNRVLVDRDPTAHAEVNAIRSACRAMDAYDLSGTVLYTSCEPCPMCLGAIYWARIDAVFYAQTREDAARMGFDDRFFYDELLVAPEARRIPMRQVCPEAAEPLVALWNSKPDRRMY